MSKIFLFLLVFLSSLSAFSAEAELVSFVDPSTQTVKEACHLPQLSYDGRFVVYESWLPGAEAENDFSRGVKLVDRSAHTSQIITRDGSSGFGGYPFISSNGRELATVSYSTTTANGFLAQLAEQKKRWGKTIRYPRIADVYVAHVKTMESVLMTRGMNGEPHDGEALTPRLSRDGRYVLFTSNATNLLPAKMKPLRQVYLLDRVKNTLELISQSPEGIPANRPCAEPLMSQNARFIAFKSAATNLVKGLPERVIEYHLYLLDRKLKVLIRVDDRVKGFPESWEAGRVALDDAGETMVFEGVRQSSAPDQEPFDRSDLFLFNREEGTLAQLTQGVYEQKSFSPALSGDGRFVAFVFVSTGSTSSSEGLTVYDQISKRWELAVAGAVSNPVFSGDGSVIAYESGEPSNIYVVKNPLKK